MRQLLHPALHVVVDVGIVVHDQLVKLQEAPGIGFVIIQETSKGRVPEKNCCSFPIGTACTTFVERQKRQIKGRSK